jgi:hypothetical protein
MFNFAKEKEARRLAQQSTNEKRVAEILEELAKLDYKTIKRLQGHYTDSEWITHVAYCDALRDELDGLE